MEEKLEDGAIALYIFPESEKWSLKYVSQLLKGVIKEIVRRNREYSEVPQRYKLMVGSAGKKQLLEEVGQRYRKKWESELKRLRPTIPSKTELLYNAAISGLVGYIVSHGTKLPTRILATFLSAVLGFTSMIAIKEKYNKRKRSKLNSQLDALSKLEIISSEKPAQEALEQP
jgi:hypothetical protein